VRRRKTAHRPSSPPPDPTGTTHPFPPATPPTAPAPRPPAGLVPVRVDEPGQTRTAPHRPGPLTARRCAHRLGPAPGQRQQGWLTRPIRSPSPLRPRSAATSNAADAVDGPPAPAAGGYSPGSGSRVVAGGVLSGLISS
jgi:hypothetical protein